MGVTFDRIVVPLDGSQLAEQAIPYALNLVEPDGEVLLFRVLPAEASLQEHADGTGEAPDEALRRHRLHAGQELGAAVERWQAHAGPVRLQIAYGFGDPAEEILEIASERAAAMIVMSSTGRGAFARLALGSVTDRVARASTVPVLIVRGGDVGYEIDRVLVRRLLVPLDGSALAAAATPFAGALAKRLRALVALVTVVDVTHATSPVLAYGAAFSQELYDDVIATIRQESDEMLASAREQLERDGVTTSAAVLTGPTADAIMRVAVPGDVIVMTSHGRGGIARWLIGSVAEKLVRQGPVPVLIVPSKIGDAATRGSGVSA